MLVSTALLAAIAVAAIGTLVFWSNPQRVMNRFFFSFSLQLTAWLICVHRGVVLGEDPFWVRLASAIGTFAPWHMWLIKEACIGTPLATIMRRSAGWLVAASLLTVLCYTDWYVTRAPGGGVKVESGYFLYMAVVVCLYSIVCRQTIVEIRTQTGLSRLELQICLIGGCSMCLSIVFLMALRGFLQEIWPIHLQPLVVLLFYGGTVVAITIHRVFNARQIIRIGIQKLFLVGIAVLVAYSVDRVLEIIGLPQVMAWFVTAAVVLWTAAVSNEWLEKVMHFYPEGISVRQAAFAAARETRLENLDLAFQEVLKGWGHTEHALILTGDRNTLSGSGIELYGDSALLQAMRQMRWATPERLARERPSTDREEVARFLKEQGLGALAISEGHALTVLVAVGPNVARRPFTYPQVTQLMELAPIIGSAFERAHFSVKAQHAEQLATVGLLGASLAHEIRNPLVSIKTFVQLLPSHHQEPAFRDKFFRLISDEVTRIDQLTEQLLDLASPRAYAAQLIDLHPVLQASLELAAAKAAHKSIQFLTDFQANPDRAFTDASAAKQVMLNLCFNAIQAVESHDGSPTERWVRVATRNTDAGIEMAVADSGPGIDPEIRPKLFQPFQTTKSTGFGLGLAICSDILANLHASITVDPPVPGQGATFRVVFPCQPSSS